MSFKPCTKYVLIFHLRQRTDENHQVAGYYDSRTAQECLRANNHLSAINLKRCWPQHSLAHHS